MKLLCVNIIKSLNTKMNTFIEYKDAVHALQRTHFDSIIKTKG